jgi:hypothetical protein
MKQIFNGEWFLRAQFNWLGITPHETEIISLNLHFLISLLLYGYAPPKKKKPSMVNAFEIGWLPVYTYSSKSLYFITEIFVLPKSFCTLELIYVIFSFKADNFINLNSVKVKIFMVYLQVGV